MTPEESLELIEEERRRIGRRTRVDPALLQGVWAVAWFVGFGAAYLAYGPHRVLPGWLGPTVGHDPHRGRVRGDPRLQRPGRRRYPRRRPHCRRHVRLGLDHRLRRPDRGEHRPGHPGRDRRAHSDAAVGVEPLLLAGVLHLAGGALFADPVLYATPACATVLCAAGAVFAGVPGAFLVLSLAGGGGFAVLAVAHRWRRR